MSAHKDDQSDRGKRTTAEAAALEYASRGWPCSPETKQPLVKGDPDPKTRKAIPGTGGLKKATCDEPQIKRWWRHFPKAMMGMPTGNVIGAFVVDIDAGTDSKTGESFEAADILQNLEDQLGVRLPQTWSCRTPRGGLHLYFRVSGSEMPRNRAGLISRVDIRGEGGYVVVPPSSRADGRSYFWESGPPNMPLADAPPELLTLLRNPNAREGAPIQQTRGLRSPSRNYGLSALDSEVLSLENAAEGTRNESLFKSAIRLGQLVAAGHLKESMVRAGLESVISAWPNQQKSLGTIQSGLHRGLREPRGTSALSNGIERPPGQVEGDAISVRFLSSGAHSLGLDEDDQLQLDHELCHRSRTDLGNAERFARRMGNRLIWVSPRGWLHWDGRRWTRTGADEAAKIAAQYVARSIQREADGLRGTDADTVVETRSPGAKFERQIRISDKLADWGRESESDRHLTAVLKQAAPMMAINQSRLDSDPFKINTKNGTLQVARGRSDGDPVSFRPHDPIDLITKVIDADFDPNATCPTYDAFLKMVQPSAQVRRFLHQWAGLALTGDTSEQKLAFFWGKGRNGKTTLTEGWAGIFGDYACSLPIETFMDNGRARSGGQATPDLAILPGIRFVHTDEPARNAKLSEKGRVERAHHTLQDRLVKELRLAGISTIKAANAFLPSFVANYNGRFAKLPARDKDLHRLLDPRQDLDEVLCWREQRQVSHQLVVNYSRMKLTLKPEGLAVRLRGKMVDVYDFPDGRLEVRWKGRSLPYSAFDKLQRVSHAAIVENKRLGEILAWIKEQQDRQPRFNRVPDGPRRSSQKPGILKNRALQIAEAAKLKSQTPGRGRRRSDMVVSAAPAHAPSEAAE